MSSKPAGHETNDSNIVLTKKEATYLSQFPLEERPIRLKLLRVSNAEPSKYIPLSAQLEEQSKQLHRLQTKLFKGKK